MIASFVGEVKLLVLSPSCILTNQLDGNEKEPITLLEKSRGGILSLSLSQYRYKVTRPNIFITSGVALLNRGYFKITSVLLFRCGG